MDINQFLNTVRQMRIAQKSFFSGNKDALRLSKDLEKQVDGFLKPDPKLLINSLFDEPQPVKTTLFACPYSIATTCNLQEGCIGCETFHANRGVISVQTI